MNKMLLAAVAAFLTCVNSEAQSFGTRSVLDGNANNPTSINTADLDGDGDLDALTADLGGIKWYANPGPAGTWTKTTLALTSCREVVAADLDGDGDLDLVAASEFTHTIAWFENLGGGAFGPAMDITNTAFGARGVHAADLDGDGDLDVLSASRGDNRIMWYENSGAGAFGSPQLITDQAMDAARVTTADLDGDGDLDVISTNPGDARIVRYMNQGGASFGAGLTIDSTASGAFGLDATDLDGDGDVDVLATLSGSNEVVWYSNNGAGGFGVALLISNDVSNPLSVESGDLDGDGDADVLGTSTFDNEVYWVENQGGGVFSGLEVITDQEIFAKDACVGDLDGDGDLDVLYCGLSAVSSSENLMGVSLPIASIEVLRLQFERQLDESVRVPESDYPWGFDLAVTLDGGAPPLSPEPTVSGPISLQEPFFNGGVLGYNPEEEWHNIGSGGHGWGTTTEAEMDSLFGNGTYDFQVAGSSVSLDLQNVNPVDGPLLTPNQVGVGGGWHDGKYYFVGTSSHTITVSPFSEFGTNAEDVIDYWIEGCGVDQHETFFASQGGSNQIVIDIDATSMAMGTDYLLEVCFTSASDLKSFAGVPAFAAYQKCTSMVFQVVSEGSAFGTNYCDGGGAELVATGYPFTGGNDPLYLVASGLPVPSVGFFLVSSTQGFIPNPGGSQGNLCLTGNIGRIYNGSGAFAVDGCGSISLGINTLQLPQPGGNVAIQPGETWNFQAWYRDQPTPTFTNGLSVTFQ